MSDQGDTTLGTVTSATTRGEASLAPVLTILAHPDATRIGERSRLNDPAGDGHVRISRLTPAFGPPHGADSRPLGDAHTSRKPVLLTLNEDGSVRFRAGAKTRLRIQDEPIEHEWACRADELDEGVVVQLGDRIALLFHMVPARTPHQANLGMVGVSRGLAEVRRAAIRVAAHDVPVLLRGESGAGKELVARAIHAQSARSDGPFVCVNMAALVPTTAAAELFGFCKGAFTGAETSSDGFYGAADGGTLFLDEIADTPADVQPALLRALETGEVQPLGGRAFPRDVRIVSATDANLEQAIVRGRFRLPLMQRLCGYEIHVPPLRARREDVGLLLYHWLRRALEDVGLEEKLETLPGTAPWLSARLVARAALAPWPGNVRELRNMARSLVIDWADAMQIPEDLAIARWLSDSPEPPVDLRATFVPSEPKPPERRPLRTITDDELVAVLGRHDYQPGRAAEALGISRTSIYALIAASDRVRKSVDLTRDEIDDALVATHGDVREAASRLRVSERALRLRMKKRDR